MNLRLHRLLIMLLGSCIAQAEVSKADNPELYEGPEFKRAFTNPQDNPALPRVLLIGDSISIGYTVPVRRLLAGKANVHRIPGNGRYAAYGVEHLAKWLGKGSWDLIHFNWGLWDLCYRHPESKNQGKRDKLNGTLTATPEQYRQSLEQAVAILKKTGAKLVWCHTTPVPEGEAGRVQGSAVTYNRIAGEVMKAHDIPINDLHSHALTRLAAIQIKPGDVHFNAMGNEHLAKQVAASILQVLEVR